METTGASPRRSRWLARAADADAAPLRRVGWQLAAFTVGLLFALLLVVGGTIYFTTQQLLRDSLQHTLRDRAEHPPPPIMYLIQTDSPEPPSGAQPPPDGRFTFHPDSGGVFFTALDTRLIVLGGTGPFTPPLSDPGQAVAALRNGTACCGQQSYKGENYLIYSKAVVDRDGQVLGVVQTSISMAQYQSTLQSLLHVLLAVAALALAASAAISGLLVWRALRPIQAALQRQRDFVADAAHELRTPLAIMRTAAELGLAQETLAEQQRALEQTLEQNAHLSRLVDSLSLLARADSGAVSLEQQRVDLGRLVPEVASGVQVLAEERGVSLHVEATPGALVLGDGGRLRQVLLILLDNALKYTPEGGSIRVRVDRSGGTVRLQVQDSGPGIGQDDLPHLFERFYRADRARSGEGTGLGLAIGRWIVEAHGGHIAAANAAPHGALFTVTLPAS